MGFHLIHSHYTKGKKMAAPTTKKTDVSTRTEAPTVKDARFHAGVELMGSKTSANYKLADIYVTQYGLECVSKKEKRSVIVPWPNVRCYELL